MNCQAPHQYKIIFHCIVFDTSSVLDESNGYHTLHLITIFKNHQLFFIFFFWENDRFFPIIKSFLHHPVYNSRWSLALLQVRPINIWLTDPKIFMTNGVGIREIVDVLIFKGSALGLFFSNSSSVLISVTLVVLFCFQSCLL